MLGLTVLAVCVLYVSLALFVANRIGQRRNSTLAKILTLVVFVLIPTWDIVPGQLYHQHLCQTEGGVRVFKTIEVEKAYFLPDGRPDEKSLQARVDWRTSLDRAYSATFHIAKSEGILIDKKTGDRLGTATDFWYYGGWLMTSLHMGGGTICPQYPNFSVSSGLLREVVRPQFDAHLGGR